MATSPETFNQVKNILRKLDRSIDEIRTRRVAPPPGQNAAVNSAALAGQPARARPLNRDPRAAF